MAEMNAKTPYFFTNHSGDKYFVHEGKTKTNRPKYFVSKRGDGAIAKVPRGFEVAENINGQVFVRKPLDRSLISSTDLKAARSVLKSCKHLKDYKIETKGSAIIVFQPDNNGAILALQREKIAPFSDYEPMLKLLGRNLNDFLKQIANDAGCSPKQIRSLALKEARERKERLEAHLRANTHFSPIMRFTLGKAGNKYQAERKCFRGEQNWLPLESGAIKTLAKKYIRHIGKDSFFDLI